MDVKTKLSGRLRPARPAAAEAGAPGDNGLANALATQEPRGLPSGSGIGDFLLFVVKLVGIVLAVRIALFAPFSIPSESMHPRLWTGDTLIAAKWPYGYSRHSLPFDLALGDERIFANLPERGDVAIFKHPIDEQDYIKRVIGLPGDEVAMRSGVLILNGEPVRRERRSDFEIPLSPNTDCVGGVPILDRGEQGVCRYVRWGETLPNGRSFDVLDLHASPQDSFDPVLVPEGQLFVLGDNRDRSMDSRFEAIAGLGTGLVPQANLVGRAAIVIWSSDGSASWSDPASWLSATRWDRIGSNL